MRRALADKILKSGLIDKATAELMEKFGILDEGSADIVNDDALKDATKEKLEEIVETLAEEVEKMHALRETYLDLERLRWPTSVHLWSGTTLVHPNSIPAVLDRQGRYYFRFQDVDPEWFVPGRHIARDPGRERETIVESQVLYIEESPVAVQVYVQSD